MVGSVALVQKHSHAGDPLHLRASFEMITLLAASNSVTVCRSQCITKVILLLPPTFTRRLPRPLPSGHAGCQMRHCVDL